MANKERNAEAAKRSRKMAEAKKPARARNEAASSGPAPLKDHGPNSPKMGSFAEDVPLEERLRLSGIKRIDPETGESGLTTRMPEASAAAITAEAGS